MFMTLIENIAKNIEQKRQNLSVDKLSKKADIPSATIWKILRKEVADVKVSTLIALANALECSIDDLIK